MAQKHLNLSMKTCKSQAFQPQAFSTTKSQRMANEQLPLLPWDTDLSFPCQRKRELCTGELFPPFRDKRHSGRQVGRSRRQDQGRGTECGQEQTPSERGFGALSKDQVLTAAWLLSRDLRSSTTPRTGCIARNKEGMNSEIKATPKPS